MNDLTELQKHILSCWQCKYHPKNPCQMGQMLRLHEMIESLKKKEMKDQDYCNGCDVISNPKCGKCIGE